MDDSIVVGIAENFTLCLLALPVVMLGIVLSVKRWLFYPVAVAGFIWMVYTVYGPVGVLRANPEVVTSIKIMAWAILPIFFAILNIGAIVTIRGARRWAAEKKGKVLA